MEMKYIGRGVRLDNRGSADNGTGQWQLYVERIDKSKILTGSSR